MSEATGGICPSFRGVKIIKEMPIQIRKLVLQIMADGHPIADIKTWLTTDQSGQHTIAAAVTDQNGKATFYVDRKKRGPFFGRTICLMANWIWW